MEYKCNKAHALHENPDFMYILSWKKKKKAHPTKDTCEGAGLRTDLITVSGPRLA